MKTLYLDPFSGIAGDMFLGLMIDLGVNWDAVEQDLRKLPVTGYEIHRQQETRRGVSGCQLQVEIEEQHHHRTWAHIDAMLTDSALPQQPKELARRIFRRIGEAEGKVHGVPLEKVHFHEVGAVDSIIDVVGAALCLHQLAPERIVCAPLSLSHGSMTCAHGTFPLPAPATLEILRGCPVRDGSSDKELVTPTGAAIVAEIAEWADFPAMTIERIGYGVGSRDLADRPNVLRGIWGESVGSAATLETDRVSVIESHLDDANPEWLGPLLNDLLQAGALDVAYTPLQMKKNRPGVKVTILSPPHLTTDLARQLLRASSATGVRIQQVDRLKLRRENASITTSLGEAMVKLFFDGDELLRIAPEYESCRELAVSHALPLPEVYRLVEQAAHEGRQKAKE